MSHRKVGITGTGLDFFLWSVQYSGWYYRAEAPDKIYSLVKKFMFLGQINHLIKKIIAHFFFGLFYTFTSSRSFTT